MAKADNQPQEAQNLARKAIKEALGDRSIVFVGMMGSGKTAIGKIVASALNMPFFDSDKEIVDAADLDIPQIFEKYGEAYFRSGEERVIKRLLEEGPKILSLGGGAFMSSETRDVCKQYGISVWLKGDADLLMSRILKRPGTRPILKTDNPRQTLIDLIKERDPIYAQANVHVESSRSSKAKTRDNAILAIHDFLS